MKKKLKRNFLQVILFYYFKFYNSFLFCCAQICHKFDNSIYSPSKLVSLDNEKQQRALASRWSFIPWYFIEYLY